jgi:predicted nucleic acid-binding protein
MMIADTDALIDYLQGRPPMADRIALELQHGQLSTTAIARFELLASASSPRQERLIAELLAALPCLLLDAAAADRAARIRRDLEQGGVIISMADCLVAGITLESNGVLLTQSRQRLGRIPGLALETVTT